MIPPVQRNNSGYRDYATNDLNWIYLVKSLFKPDFSIESLTEFSTLVQLREKKCGRSAKKYLGDRLQKLDNKITEYEVRNLLEYKINTYDEGTI
ncbi:hypothetical protein [Desemzia sp. FAM 23991]|uniref:hypothetical protein n=1 Tax=unclassified Desemzia TaxID=2685243 RepID=UPI003888E46E